MGGCLSVAHVLCTSLWHEATSNLIRKDMRHQDSRNALDNYNANENLIQFEIRINVKYLSY